MVLLQPKLHLKVSQRQILTPGLVQMVSVLALNKLELKDMITAEMVENPVLEELEDSVPLLDDVNRREEDRERPAATAEENPIAALGITTDAAGIGAEVASLESAPASDWDAIAEADSEVILSDLAAMAAPAEPAPATLVVTAIIPEPARVAPGYKPGFNLTDLHE